MPVRLAHHVHRPITSALCGGLLCLGTSLPVIAMDTPQHTTPMLRYTPEDETRWTQLLQDYLRTEHARFIKELPGKFDVVLLRIYDGGNFVAFPGTKLLPFFYAESLSEVEKDHHHFTYPISWKVMTSYISDFDVFYHNLPDGDHEEEAFLWGFDELLALKIKVLRAACTSLPKDTQVVAFVHDTPFWVPLAIHVSGPALPDLPVPHSDVSVFCRLRHASHNYVGKSAFKWDGQHIAEVGIDGSELDDAALQFLFEIADLKKLCPALRLITMKNSSVTTAMAEKVRQILLGVTIEHSEYRARWTRSEKSDASPPPIGGKR